MSDLTWVIVLGSIAILFPILVTATYEELEITGDFQNVDVNLYNDEAYKEIKNMTCNDYDRDLMVEYKHYFNVNFLSWLPSKLEINSFCLINNAWFEGYINNSLYDYDEIITYDLTNNRGVSKLVNAMGIGKFFDAIDTLPFILSTLIYSIYTMLILWLIYKAVTLA